MDKKRLARIVKEEVQNLFEMYGRRGMGGGRRPAAPYGYGMGPYDSTKGEPEIDPFEAGTGDYRPRRPAGPPSLMSAGLSRTQGELFVLPKTGLFNIRLYDDNLEAVGSEVERKLYEMPEDGVVRVRIVNFSRQTDVEGTLEVKSVSEEGRNVLKGYEATIKMGGTEFTGMGQRAADAIAAADDARAAGSAGGSEMGPGPMEPMSESRWGQLAGLMTEGRKSTGEKRLFASPPHDLDASEKDLARGIGLDVKGDSVVGTMKQQRAFYERLAQKAKKTGPASVPPFDKDAYELVDGPEEVDEGSGAAPGSDPKRLPKPPNPKKDGPPGKEDLDKIKNLGPFERKKR